MRSRKNSSATTVHVSGPSAVERRKWEAEEALHVMTRAEEIKRDASLMREVKKLATQKQQALSKVTSASSKVTSRKG